MTKRRYQPGPFLDSYGLGFDFPGRPGPRGRHRTIAAVSWDGSSRDAQFVNGAGLAVPCEPLDGLPAVLAHAKRREYGVIAGDGLFAKSAATLKAWESSGLLRKWVTYHFDLGEFGLYFDDSAAWEAHVQADIAELSPGYFLEMAEFDRKQLQRRCFDSAQSLDDLTPSLPDLPTSAELEERRQQAIAERLADLHEQRRQALEQDRQLGAWLRGELPEPPLLRLAGAA